MAKSDLKNERDKLFKNCHYITEILIITKYFFNGTPDIHMLEEKFLYSFNIL